MPHPNRNEPVVHYARINVFGRPGVEFLGRPEHFLRDGLDIAISAKSKHRLLEAVRALKTEVDAVYEDTLRYTEGD